MAERSQRPRPSTQAPRLPAARLWLQACPRWQPRCRQQVGSCGTQPAPSASSSLPGACAGVVALAPESTTKLTRVHPGYLSVAPLEPVSVLPPKAERLPTGGLPLVFSAFSAFLLFSLFRSLRRFFAFLTAVTFASDGGSSLVRAFGSGNSSCASSSNNALRACLERGAAAFSSFSSFLAKEKTFSFFPAPGWSKRRAQVS